MLVCYFFLCRLNIIDIIFLFFYQNGHIILMKTDGLERHFQSLDSSDHPMVGSISGRHLLSCIMSHKNLVDFIILEFQYIGI